MNSSRALLLLGGLVTISFLIRLFSGGEWQLSKIKPPWDARPSIYEHIIDHIVEGKYGLSDGGDELPDDSEAFDKSSFRWVSGGLDGAFGHHGDGGNDSAVAKKIFGLLKSFLKNPSDVKARVFYDELRNGSSMDYVDPLLEMIVNDSSIEADRLHDLAIWLAEKSADREPVKIALSFLSALQGYDDWDTILTLARHEEFTLYSTVVVTNRKEHPETTLLEIAKNVDGWGRIQVVERLAKTSNPEIKRWLLREGYKNSIMYEYLAYTCATIGDLRSELSANEIDDNLLLGSGEIIQALVTGLGGPGKGMDDYADGASVTQLYLAHLNGRANSLDQFLVLKTIQKFLSDSGERWNERSKVGWTEKARETIQTSIDEFVEDQKWRSMVLKDLQSSDRITFSTAAEAANHLGIDTWDEYFRRTIGGEGYWYFLMQTNDRRRAQKVVELAENQIPLTEVATGPGDDLGLGAEFKFHNALDFVLQDLRRFPGLGWPLIEAGMRSPTIPNRNMAIRALAAWDQDQWPSGAKEYVEKCRSEEPDEKVREMFTQLLDGKHLD